MGVKVGLKTVSCCTDELLLNNLIHLAQDQFADLELLKESMALFDAPPDPSSFSNSDNSDNKLQMAYRDLYDQSCALGRFINTSAERLQEVYSEFELDRVRQNQMESSEKDFSMCEFISPEDYFTDFRSPPGSVVREELRDRTPMKELDDILDREMLDAKLLIQNNEKIVAFAEMDTAKIEQQLEEIVALAIRRQGILDGNPAALDHSVSTISFSISSYSESASTSESEARFSDTLSNKTLSKVTDKKVEVSNTTWQKDSQKTNALQCLRECDTDSDNLSDPCASEYLFDSTYRADPQVVPWWEAAAKQLRDLADEGSLEDAIAELALLREGKGRKVDWDENREGNEEEEVEWVLEF